MIRPAARNLSGWGNWPVQRCHVLRPERVGELAEALAGGGQSSYISRGLGRSYGDSALNEHAGVLLHTRLDRMLAFDEQTGTLEAEAGVPLSDVIDVFLPRGFFPPVTPGTKHLTLGGAIAADVHGKNHHVDGSVGNFVGSIKLLTGTGEVIDCSREQNADAFRATLGGMGLTGAIVSAKLRLRRVPSAYVNVEYRRAANLDRALELFAAGDRQHRYSVAWIDCLASGDALGRSVLMAGDHAPADRVPARQKADPLRPPRRRGRSVPFRFPNRALNSLSVRAFNALYYARHGDGGRVVDSNTFFYPLDSIRHWNRMYGRRGFLQYQCVLPPDSARTGLVQLLERLSSSRRASFLAVLKAFGAEGEGMLSFPRPGYTLALDLPNTGTDLIDFLRGLDEVVVRHGGRVYLAKDACLRRELFEAMYPRLAEFKAVKARLDPNGLFSSSQARRLGIVSNGGGA
jgi:decaprenylphospho-beta-D-ribofuranose 2-oxidase